MKVIIQPRAAVGQVKEGARGAAYAARARAFDNRAASAWGPAPMWRRCRARRKPETNGARTAQVFIKRRPVAKQKTLLFEKKQKLLHGCRRLFRDSMQKFFGSFFKKEPLSFRQAKLIDVPP
jgi:hypothetical protein